MLKNLLFILLISNSGFLYSQVNVDSLWRIWNDKKQADTTRLASIHMINRETYLFAKPDSAFILGVRQYNFAKQSGSKKWMAEARNTQGIALHIQGNYVEAIDYYSKGIRIAEEIDDKKSLAGSLNNIGIIYNDQGNYDKAREYFERSLKIKEEIGAENGVANSLGNIGAIYMEQEDLVNALSYFERGLKIQEKLDDKRGIAGFLNNVGSVYLKTKEFNKALDYFDRSLKIRSALGDKKGMASCKKNIAMVHLDLKDYKKAVLYGKQALEIAQKAGVILEENESAEVLYKSYKKLGDYKNSLMMHELYRSTSDTIKNSKNQNEIIQQEFRYNYEKKRLADSVMNAEERKVKDALFTATDAENKHNKLLIKKRSEQAYYLYGLLSLAVLFGLFIFNRFRTARKQKNIIEEQKRMVDEAFDELGIKNKEILDSINYAKRIQTAMLPSDKVVREYLNDSFILYKPKDIVAGDFYWMESKEGKILFAAADCTGHGVPGAMVSVVCNNGLNRSVREYGLTDPGAILDKTRDLVIQEFEKSQNTVTDGMDIALCMIDKDVLKYAGAHNSLWIIRGGEFIELKADKQPIGKFDKPMPYSTQEFKLIKGDTIYAFTDGYVDQFGGENDKKLKSKFLKESLISMQELNLEEQKIKLDQDFEKWKGTHDQIDDVCVIGVRH